MPDVKFSDKGKKPDEESLRAVLGPSFEVWQEIIGYVHEKFSPITEEWKFYGKNYGWQLKLLKKKRNLCFMIPHADLFKIAFIFGDKAVAEVEKNNVREDLKQVLRDAKKYMEGRGLPIEVSDRTYLKDIFLLFDIKINN